MHYREAIETFTPQNDQEAGDKAAILSAIETCGDKILARECDYFHITSSGFVMDETLSQVLLVHHNILKTWAWTGGHADGETDLLAVALREAGEETGIAHCRPLHPGVASLDILPVPGHHKNGRYVHPHLHLSAAFILVAGSAQPLSACEGENTGAAWFPLDYFSQDNLAEYDSYLYQKLIARARAYRGA